ncbi:Fe-S protein assembly chaperone HscA [Psychrobacter sp. I-STPA10]|uniref:Fe-S protein assembly chaperone HscA n=1 Tax=Psychrobacter sp. I-STPA10 TaxID=2585769 RepID=UPI001E3BAA11|nr:Fe-S protein assembly chaperone HscA [Psychrobacter sp. I-STPA10]
MSLLQIAEPQQSSKPHSHRYALGIDLGTTRSIVAVVRSGKAAVIPATDSSDTLLPSVVYYGDPTTHTPVVGQAALIKQSEDPSNTIISAKRFMGRSHTDIKFSHPYQLSGQQDAMPTFVTKQGDISPVQVSADILKALKQRAQEALPEDSIAGAVITVPAYFDEAQRQATKDAAAAAGLNVLRLLNEPTAAAVAYGLDSQESSDSHSDAHDAKDTHSRLYLIYDLGGGTFDVSILKMTAGVFEVVATGGNSALGGDDIDRLIANWLLKQAGLDAKSISNEEKSYLAQQAKQYKQALSEQDSVRVDISITDNGHSKQWQGELTTEILAKIIEPVSRRTLDVCKQVLRDANLNSSDLDHVILVGGSTRMPLIQSLVADFFATKPLCHINPDEVVALGAAQTANQLINTDKSDNVLLLDVTPLSLGLETMGGLVEVLIPRNTPIPVSKRQIFTTYQDGQTGMVIHVVQGERETVENCRSLGRFELYGIPPMKAGFARIEVTFSIDANGQLTVSAEETTTNTKSEIAITPSYGLTDEQKEQLLMAGFEHAESDKQARSLIETKVEAEREILALNSAMTEFANLLDADKTQALQLAIEDLQQAIASDDLAVIEQQQAKLKPLSDAFAAQIMNQSIQATMAGTKTSEWS